MCLGRTPASRCRRGGRLDPSVGDQPPGPAVDLQFRAMLAMRVHRHRVDQSRADRRSLGPRRFGRVQGGPELSNALVEHAHASVGVGQRDGRRGCVGACGDQPFPLRFTLARQLARRRAERARRRVRRQRLELLLHRREPRNRLVAGAALVLCQPPDLAAELVDEDPGARGAQHSLLQHGPRARLDWALVDRETVPAGATLLLPCAAMAVRRRQHVLGAALPATA